MKNKHSFFSERLARPLAVAGLIGVLSMLLVTAFSWPASNIAPRDVPVAVVGPAPAVSALEEALEQRAPGAFDLRSVAARDDAVEQVEGRDVYGVVVLGETGPTDIVVATSASPGVARLLESVFAGSPEGGPQVQDVAPLPAGDPQGAGLGGAILPLTLTGVLAAILGLRLIPRISDRLTAAVLAAVAVGTGVWLVLDPWLGVIGGSGWSSWSLLVLGAAALGLAAAGTLAVHGYHGISIITVAFVLLGNPLSGSSSAPELLPEGWSTLGQLLPQGAIMTSLRSTSGFDGAGASMPVLVLVCWVVFGLALLGWSSARRHVVGHRREDERDPEPATA